MSLLTVSPCYLPSLPSSSSSFSSRWGGGAKSRNELVLVSKIISPPLWAPSRSSNTVVSVIADGFCWLATVKVSVNLFDGILPHFCVSTYEATSHYPPVASFQSFGRENNFVLVLKISSIDDCNIHLLPCIDIFESDWNVTILKCILLI